MTGGSSRSTTRRSMSAVSPRPRVGSRYNYSATNATSSQTTDNNSHVTRWGKLRQLERKQMWCRLVAAFTIISVSGVACIMLGAVFLERAYEIHKEEDISLPYIWSIIGMVCGCLLLICSVILGKMVLSSTCKTQRHTRSNQVRESPSHSTVTFIPSRRRAQSGAEASASHLDLGQPPPYDPSGRSGQALPPAAVFIISQGDVNMAIPALVENHLTPPKYENLSLAKPPNYSVTDPLKLPKYDELSRADSGRGDEQEEAELVLQIDSCQSNPVIREEVRNSLSEIGGVENEGFEEGVSPEEVRVPSPRMEDNEISLGE